MRHLVLAVLLSTPAVAADNPDRIRIEPRTRTGSRSSQRVQADIRITTQMVVVPITVLDEKGAPVLGLGQDRFRVFEDGVEQTIRAFGQEDAGVSIGIVFDASRSMEYKLEQAREAVTALFLDALPEDEFQLVEFNNAPRMVCDLTKDAEQVRRALDTVEAKGWTALFDGILLSAKGMRKAVNPRRALVIISDGEDNFSRYHESELRSYLREAGVVVYAITIGDGEARPHQTRHLRRITRETGGWAYSVGRLEKMAETVRAIGTAIRNQYFLSYTPTNDRTDGKFRKIGLELSESKRWGMATSWRSGYYALGER